MQTLPEIYLIKPHLAHLVKVIFKQVLISVNL